MQSSHAAAKIDIAFDDPNLIADAGLVPVVALAERVGLPGLVSDRVKITGAANSGGANAAAKVMALLDVDSTHRQVYGYAKQGAAVGRLKGTKTLHPLLATISMPIARPVIAGIRLRRGKSADVRGAAVLVAEALATARTAGCTGVIVVRGDSKFYTAEVAAAAARSGAFVSITTGSNPSVDAAITTIDPKAWTAIHYPNAFVDEDTGELISDAEVAEIDYTAFGSRPK